MRRLLAVIALGSIVAFFDGLFHVAGKIRLFGAEGIVWPGWLVMLVAPVVLFVAVTCYQAVGLMAARRKVRRPAR